MWAEHLKPSNQAIDWQQKYQLTDIGIEINDTFFKCSSEDFWKKGAAYLLVFTVVKCPRQTYIILCRVLRC